MPTLDKKPVSVSAVRAAAALATENAHRVEPALVTVASPPETPQSSSATEAAVMARIQSIMEAAGEGQERLCIELITQGKSELEAVKALNADLKAQNAELKSQLAAKAAEPSAEPKKPEVSKEEVVAELLKRYQAAAPQIPPTASQGEPNVYEKYKSISNSAERQKFYLAHKAEIDEIADKQKKEAV
jgi:hypothetical protein